MFLRTTNEASSILWASWLLSGDATLGERSKNLALWRRGTFGNRVALRLPFGLTLRLPLQSVDGIEASGLLLCRVQSSALLKGPHSVVEASVDLFQLGSLSGWCRHAVFYVQPSLRLRPWPVAATAIHGVEVIILPSPLHLLSIRKPSAPGRLIFYMIWCFVNFCR